MSAFPLVRVRTDKGWEIWDNVKKIVIPYPQLVHLPSGEVLCELPADLPTVTTVDDIDIRVYEVQVVMLEADSTPIVTTYSIGEDA